MLISSFVIRKTLNKHAISGGRLREEDGVLESPEWGNVEANLTKLTKKILCCGLFWIINYILEDP